MSKGSRQRPIDYATYSKNYDLIFKKKKKILKDNGGSIVIKDVKVKNK